MFALVELEATNTMLHFLLQLDSLQYAKRKPFLAVKEISKVWSLQIFWP